MLKALLQETSGLSVSNDQGHLGDWPDSKEFWRNRRVMVTGGNGFLGKNIVRKLNARGADVFIVDVDGYDPSATLRACLRRLEDIRRALVVIHPSTPLRAGSCRVCRRHPTPLCFGD